MAVVSRQLAGHWTTEDAKWSKICCLLWCGDLAPAGKKLQISHSPFLPPLLIRERQKQRPGVQGLIPRPSCCRQGGKTVPFQRGAQCHPLKPCPQGWCGRYRTSAALPHSANPRPFSATRTFDYAKTWDPRLVSLPVGKHRGSAWAGWLLLPARCQQSGIWAVLLDVPASSAPFQQPLVAVAPCWAQLGCLFPEHSSCHLPRAKHQAGCDLLQTLPWALPSCARGDADPSACWALLCEDLLPPWGEWGRAPSSQPCAVPSRARGAACCCTSAALCHRAGPPPPATAAGSLGGKGTGVCWTVWRW